VRLTFGNGQLVEDTVDNGVVLFFEPRAVVGPVDVSILDAAGGTLVSYPEFGGFAPPT